MLQLKVLSLLHFQLMFIQEEKIIWYMKKNLVRKTDFHMFGNPYRNGRKVDGSGSILVRADEHHHPLWRKAKAKRLGTVQRGDDQEGI